nr:hypothetical protein [Parabacteroides goldsteinii]
MEDIKCFVIMKFGHTEEEQKHSLSKYENYIVPALIEAGYSKEQIKRADSEAQKGGSMKEQIFENLFNSELVIADITGGNSNVFYELGIRHVFKKRGTIILTEKSQTIPFDLADDYIHQFELSLGTLTLEKQTLTDLIQKRKSNYVDSPVYSRLKELDENKISGNTQPNKNKGITKPLEKENDELRKEISRLNEKLSEKQTESGLLNFEVADKSLGLYGEEIAKDLTISMLNGDIDSFKVSLSKINVENDYIDARDFRHIADLCQKVGLLPHKIMILEFAFKKYPQNDSIFIDLMDAYIASPSKKHNDLAKKQIESFYHIKNDSSGLPIFTEDSLKVIDYASANNLSTVFDLYATRNEYRELSNIVSSAEDILKPSNKNLIIRNKAIALRALGDNEKAIALFKKIITDNPTDSDLRLIADSFYRIGQSQTGYKFYELRTIINYDNAWMYTSLAHQIYAGQITRTIDGFRSTRANKRVAKRSIIPLLLKSMEITPYEDIIIEVKRILHIINAHEEIQYMIDNSYSYDSYLERFKDERNGLYDWTILEYIEKNKKDDIDVNKYVEKILTATIYSGNEDIDD